MNDSESKFSFAKWQDESDVASNPVEMKIRKDWLSLVLFDNLDGYKISDDDVDEFEFLDHYADRFFVECLNLARRNPIAINVNGHLQVKNKSGWFIEKNQFADIFNDKENVFTKHFSQWLNHQDDNGSNIMVELLSVYCNQGEDSLKNSKLTSLNAP